MSTSTNYTLIRQLPKIPCPQKGCECMMHKQYQPLCYNCVTVEIIHLPQSHIPPTQYRTAGYYSNIFSHGS